jgi:hypothetical protein
LFETLKAGRVPVILSDGYVLPSGIDWNQCALVVREADAREIPSIIGSRMDDWTKMANRARQTWLDNFSDESILSYLARQLRDIQNETPDADLHFKVSYTARVAGVLVEQRMRPVAGRIRRRISRAMN